MLCTCVAATITGTGGTNPVVKVCEGNNVDACCGVVVGGIVTVGVVVAVVAVVTVVAVEMGAADGVGAAIEEGMYALRVVAVAVELIGTAFGASLISSVA